MTKIRHLGYVGMALLIMTGCQKTSVSDEVDGKLDNIHQTQIPTPVPKNIDATALMVDYQATNDPFVSPFYTPSASDLTDGNAEKTKASSVTNVDKQPKSNIGIYYGKKVRLDKMRPHEILENYPLSSLSYRGRIEQGGRVSALVLDSDGVVHFVKVGQFIGQNHGKISHIDRHEIIIQEAILQADGHYYEQINRLRFYP